MNFCWAYLIDEVQCVMIPPPIHPPPNKSQVDAFAFARLSSDRRVWSLQKIFTDQNTKWGETFYEIGFSVLYTYTWPHCPLAYALSNLAAVEGAVIKLFCTLSFYEQMSVAESPVHSSSSDDFTGFLERALGSGSSHSSPDEEADYESDDGSERSTKRRKVENLGSIEETHGSTSQVFVEENSEASPKKDICTHPGSVKDLCIVCGQRVDEKSGVPLGYIHKDFWLNNDEIDRVRSTDIKKSLHLKKLYLVLDLDHTLLNSTHLNHMTAEEEYLHSQTDSLQDVSNGSLFRVDVMHMMTKLRPFVRNFLKEASEMFEMYIYTMGERAYALEMAKLLDPRKEYFGDRVISRDDGTQKHQKGLDVVLRA
ncbi:hypothetical protein Pyn_21837 [Prunus yedoensis var. nudiflora]|uniref:RNA polymerase II C-terminal domain phosphatase-like n=1 Tax=Prunus yedoensis var. nudiflora TaxID=2094558 RepID=A0A314UE83_PRUYE|nr:hypothetical protein Pyn_21837 [Prunus yedoensis var. nudiflora]